VDVAEGDLDAPATIDAAMPGVTSIVLVSPAIPAQELSVIDSAARTGVGHVVKITSKAAADSPIARQRGQAEIEAGLIASGLNYTLLRNNFYMQNFLMLAPGIAQTDSFGSSAGAGQVGFIDTRDVAAVAAEIAAAPAAHVGTTYMLYRAAAALLRKCGGDALQGSRPSGRVPPAHPRGGRTGDDRRRRSGRDRRDERSRRQPDRRGRRGLAVAGRAHHSRAPGALL
jgi:hypothetical protein